MTASNGKPLKMGKADLHMHTSLGDGLATVQQIFDFVQHHTDLDIIVRTYNGESVGTWEGDTLVVDTIGFRGDHHWMDQGGVAIPAGEQLHIVERFKMVGPQLEIEYTMTDPEHWEGDWKSTKRFNRVTDEDIQEVSCLPDLNEHLQSTTSKTQVLK